MMRREPYVFIRWLLAVYESGEFSERQLSLALARACASRFEKLGLELAP